MTTNISFSLHFINKKKNIDFGEIFWGPAKAGEARATHTPAWPGFISQLSLSVRTQLFHYADDDGKAT